MDELKSIIAAMERELTGDYRPDPALLALLASRLIPGCPSVGTRGRG